MATFPRVSPAEALELIAKGYTYVDVRSEPEYAAGHPKGALNVPVAVVVGGGMQPNPRFVEVIQKLFPKDAKLVVGCKAGGRSMKAAELLTSAGFSDVVDQRAGWDGLRDAFGKLSEPGWAPAGLPSETATPGGSYEELVKKSG